MVVSSKRYGEYGTEASLTDINGKDEAINWSDDSEATAYSQCSLVYEDQIYFFGQVYKQICVFDFMLYKLDKDPLAPQTHVTK